MKLLSVISLFLYTSTTMAYGSLVIKTDKQTTIEIAWLGTEPDENQVELAWENGGQNSLHNGDVCFKGKRTEAAKVLNHLSQNDFLGDEYRVQNIRYIGTDKMSYEVFDGPNEVVSKKAVISNCQK